MDIQVEFTSRPVPQWLQSRPKLEVCSLWWRWFGWTCGKDWCQHKMPGPWLRIVDCGDESRLGITKRSICHLRVFRLQQKPITTQEHSIRLSAVPVPVPSELYLSKLINVFVWIEKCICLNLKVQHLCVQTVNASTSTVLIIFFWIDKCIWPNWQMYLSKLTYVFLWIDKCICLNWEMYLSKLKSAASVC